MPAAIDNLTAAPSDLPRAGRQLLTRAEMRAKLHLSDGGIDTLVNNGILPAPLKLSGGIVRWFEDEVDGALGNAPRVSYDPPPPLPNGAKRGPGRPRKTTLPPPAGVAGPAE